MDRKSPSQIFKVYQVKLLRILPMDDEVFNALLIKNFFSENYLFTQLLESGATTASSLLPIIGNHVDKYFETLLNVMEVFGGPVATLAQEIKEKIGLKSYRGVLYCTDFLCVFVYSIGILYVFVLVK